MRALRHRLAMWRLRAEGRIFCVWLNRHRWKLSSGWEDCGIPDRVTCRRCGAWMVQDGGRVLRGRS